MDSNTTWGKIFLLLRQLMFMKYKINEDWANLLFNSFFAYLCQFYRPCNSWAVQLQALVSAMQKTPEVTKPYSEEAATGTAGVVV